jgi:protein-S-isoprenylcysteine O-methyltransferase Ste14
MSDVADHANVRVPPPLLYAGALILGVVLGWILHIEGWQSYGTLALYAGGTLVLLGLILMLRAGGMFRRAGTSVRPWQASSTLVTEGPYRKTRNPMYVGMTLIYIGLAIALHSIIALLLMIVVGIVMQTHVVAREERYLESRFGDDYRAYRKRVRRWL